MVPQRGTYCCASAACTPRWGARGWGWRGQERRVPAARRAGRRGGGLCRPPALGGGGLDYHMVSVGVLKGTKPLLVWVVNGWERDAEDTTHRRHGTRSATALVRGALDASSQHPNQGKNTWGCRIQNSRINATSAELQLRCGVLAQGPPLRPPRPAWAGSGGGRQGGVAGQVRVTTRRRNERRARRRCALCLAKGSTRHTSIMFFALARASLLGQPLLLTHTQANPSSSLLGPSRRPPWPCL